MTDLSHKSKSQYFGFLLMDMTRPVLNTSDQQLKSW